MGFNIHILSVRNRSTNLPSHAALAASFNPPNESASRAFSITPRSRLAGLRNVLAYLGRYTHRGAIANSRIQDCDDGHVAFAWKDYRDGGAVKTMCLKPDEFIRRFLLHALPDGFHRIRHFGFLANGHRTQKLALCRSLLTDGGEPTTRGKIESPTSAPSETLDLDPPPCPECGGVMRVIADLPRGGQRPRSERPRCDTS